MLFGDGLFGSWFSEFFGEVATLYCPINKEVTLFTPITDEVTLSCPIIKELTLTNTVWEER